VADRQRGLEQRFYGADHADEFDLRDGLIPSEKDGGKHLANARLGPAAYAAGVAAFARAMKAVDPKILVGASFTTPTTNVSWPPAARSTGAATGTANC